MSKPTVAVVVLLAASVVALAAVIGRHNEAGAVPTAAKAVALSQEWLAPRFEDVNVKRSRATRVETVDEFKSVITVGPQLTLGPNGERLPVWVNLGQRGRARRADVRSGTSLKRRPAVSSFSRPQSPAALPHY